MMAGEIVLVIIVALVLLAALAGAAVPFLPGGALLAWVALFMYAYMTDFREISGVALAVFGAMVVFTLVIDLAAPLVGIQRQKASRQALLGALLGAGLGMVVFGPPGIVLGPFLGAFAGEYLMSRRADAAFKTALAAFVGWLVGSLLKIAIVLIMAGYFAYVLIF